MRLSIYLSYISKKTIVFSALLLTLLSGFIALTASQAQTSPTSTESLVWSDEFNASAVDTSKWTVVEQQKSIESHHQGRYQKRNVSVGDGNLRIVTQRHCVTGTELPSESNASSAPCPTGTSTKYSSGQIRTPYLWKEGKMEIRAKMPETTQSGLWSGFWLRQQGAWCTPDYGEIDILEWYSDAKSTDASTATTHISCSNEDLESRQHVKRVSGSLADDWHTWGVEWDTTGVTYYLDGKVVESIASHRPNDDNQDKDTYADYDGMSQATFESVVNRPWHLRINTQVYPSDDQWHEAPDNSTPFTPQTLLVDYVRLYDTGTSIPTPAPSDDTEEKPSTPVTPSAPSNEPAEPVDTPKDEDTLTELPEETPSTTPIPTRPVNTPTTSNSSTRPNTDTPVQDTDPVTPITKTPDETPTQTDNQPVAAPQQKAANDTNTTPAIDPTTPTSLPKTGNAAQSILMLVPPVLILFTSYHWLRSRQ